MAGHVAMELYFIKWIPPTKLYVKLQALFDNYTKEAR